MDHESHHSFRVSFSLLTMNDVRDCAVLLQVNVEPVRLEVLGDHHAGLNDSSFLREVPLCKALLFCTSAYLQLPRFAREATPTTSLVWSSESFLPTNLFIHSSVLSPEPVMIPGTTRGMLMGFGYRVWVSANDLQQQMIEV